MGHSESEQGRPDSGRAPLWHGKCIVGLRLLSVELGLYEQKSEHVTRCTEPVIGYQVLYTEYIWVTRCTWFLSAGLYKS